MSRRRKGREAEDFGLSFLDCICCGFGAIILLLVLTKIGEPQALEQSTKDLEGLIIKLEEELFEIRGESRVVEQELVKKKERLFEEQQHVAKLDDHWRRIQEEVADSVSRSQVDEIVQDQLREARQRLTEEMQRLLNQPKRRKTPSDNLVGGIPVDSEYVIFVVDTSGSMSGFAWSSVREKMAQVLDIYPKVKGIQVMNDMGQFMFSQYAGQWIPDTPGRRKAILERLRSWRVFSNSSPVEGITRAIESFAKGNKKISIYVFGDEFTGGSIERVVNAVDRINTRDRDGNRLVRIHAVGFPTVFVHPSALETTGVRFANLMRILCRDNAGTFVGLNNARP